MAVIGIDLGTTNSLGAYWKDGEVQLICDEAGKALLPSVVGYVEGEGFLVGEAAKARRLRHSKDTAASFKRFMGTAKEYELGGRQYTPMELSAMVLGRIKSRAENFLKEEIEEAIVTVPAYFNDRQRSDTKKAAQIAGLKVERLINEPSAAALAYRMKYGEEDKTLLIFDFGGGTLDLSYVECFDNCVEIVAVAGDNHLGGDDIDGLIMEYFCRQNGLDPLEALPAEDAAQIRDLSEKAKCALDSQNEVHMELEIAGKMCSIDVVPKPAGQAWIDVRFTYDINGILQVAVANELGEGKKILLANQTLSDTELEMYSKEMEQIMVPPIDEPENQKMLKQFLEYYENSTGPRREMIAALIDQFIYRLSRGRKKDVRDAVLMAKDWLDSIGKEKDMQEERLFDGELRREPEEE